MSIIVYIGHPTIQVFRVKKTISNSTMNGILSMRVFNYDFRSQRDFSKILSILTNLVEAYSVILLRMSGARYL